MPFYHKNYLKRLSFWLCCLFFTGLQACHTPSEKAAPAGVTHLIDSLKKRTFSLPADSGLAVQQQISAVAREYGLTDELIRSYCRLSYFMGRTQMDFDKGKAMLDSAAYLIQTKGRRKMEPVVDLYYATLYNSRDDSLAPHYLEKLAPRLDEMMPEDKHIALCAMGNIHGQRGNAADARACYLRALDLLEKQSPRDFKSEIGLHNNLVIIYRQYLKDTLTAVQEMHKALNMCTDSIEKLGEIEYAYANFAQCYIDMGEPDSALPLVLKYKELVELYYKKREALLIPNTFLAQVAYLKKEYEKADRLLIPFGKYIDSFQMASRSLPTDWYLFKYYETLYKVKKAKGEYAAAMKALEEEKRLDDLINEKKKDDKLLQYDQNLEQTKIARALAEQDKKDANNRLILFLVIFLLLLAVAAALVLVSRNKKRLQEQKLKALQQATELEKKELLLQAENAERKRIAKEFHDELGGTVTIISLSARNLEQRNLEGSDRKTLEVLLRNSKKLNTQVNEIVWSLNDKNDELGNLLAYMQRYAAQFLSDSGIGYHISFTTEMGSLPIDGYKRRYLFQSVKECLHNVVKHSGADEVYCQADIINEALIISIADNGKGFPDEKILVKGNGIDNIRSGIQALNGKVHWEQATGTRVVIEVALTELARQYAEPA